LSDTDLGDDLYGLDFDVAKSMRYHLCRRRFWDGWSRVNKILTVLTGSAVVVGITANVPIVTTASGAAVALFSTFDLVFDFGEKARQADGLYRRWSLLLQEIALVDGPTRDRIAELRRRRLEIEMEEGPTVDLLERRCAYDEAKARGHKIDDAWNLTRWQQTIAQLVFWRPVRR
jgi:hypothetical protein